MKRFISVTFNDADGIERQMQHESTDNPTEDARFITGISDDLPGQDVTFTIRSEPESHDPKRR